MRCPKCQYISFDDGPRCRNCGYDFSLSEPDEPIDPLDLPMRRGEEPSKLVAELGLRAGPGQHSGPAVVQSVGRDTPRISRREVTPSALDLPLFNDGDDAPLISAPAVPRAPLAVRRSAPVTPRPRMDPYVAEPPALAFPEESWPEDDGAESAATPEAPDIPASDMPVAPAARRVLAAAIDVVITVAIDAAVLYYTLQACGLAPSEIRALPIVPMVAFLLLLNGGYFTMFTAAGGQTIGKMIAGIRIVPAGASDDHARVPLASAIVRAATCAGSVGLGVLMAFFRDDGRALHDAVAGTRVIRT